LNAGFFRFSTHGEAMVWMDRYLAMGPFAVMPHHVQVLLLPAFSAQPPAQATERIYRARGSPTA
jgi:hypothetical protein